MLASSERRLSPYRAGAQNWCFEWKLGSCVLRLKFLACFSSRSWLWIPSHKHQWWTVWLKINQSEDFAWEVCYENLFALNWIPAFCFALLLVSFSEADLSVYGIRTCCLQPQHQLANSLELNLKIKHSKEERVLVSLLYLLIWCWTSCCTSEI